ncbi:hypothetical protein SNEBB_008131 [Seison nebaliae]|nr:hypothetical protein SNEBB_008131 [Seison nebaliae]
MFKKFKLLVSTKCEMPRKVNWNVWNRKSAEVEKKTLIGGISEEELARHNSQDDCWISLGGNVYDITSYISCHPGGVDIIMRGAGIDATQLFMQAHPWVNASRIIDKLLIGKLEKKNKSMLLSPLDICVGNHRQTSNKQLQERQKLIEVEEWWFEKIDGIVRLNFLISKTKFNERNKNFIICIDKVSSIPSIRSNQLYKNIFLKFNEIASANSTAYLVTLKSKQYLLRFLFQLSTPFKLRESTIDIDHRFIDLKLEKDEKLEHQLEKQSISISYALNHVSDTNHLLFRLVRLELLKELTPNIYLLIFQIAQENEYFHLNFPYHTKLRMNIQSHSLPTIARPYTPVPLEFVEQLLNESMEEPSNGFKRLPLIVKYYDDGIFTKQLPKQMSSNDDMKFHISDPIPSKQTEEFFLNFKNFFLFGAGTGILPMVRLLYFLKNQIETPKQLNVNFMIYFKETDNVIFIPTIADLMEEFNGKLCVCFTGTIREGIKLEKFNEHFSFYGERREPKKFLEEFLEEKSSTLIGFSGPTSFQESCLTAIRLTGCPFNNVWQP